MYYIYLYVRVVYICMRVCMQYAYVIYTNTQWTTILHIGGGDECINCKQNWYNENYSVYINMYIYQFIFAAQMII